MQGDNKKLSQEELLKIVWKDLYRLLNDINRTFNLLLNMFFALIIISCVIVLAIIVITLLI